MENYNIDELLKLPIQKRPARLEKLAEDTLLPKEVKKCYFYNEYGDVVIEMDSDFEKYYDLYKNYLHKISFAQRPNYNMFKKMLKLFRDIYSRREFKRLNEATINEINYIIACIKED